MKDEAPVRDRIGLQFPTTAAAIEHTKELARRFGHEQPDEDRDLSTSRAAKFIVNEHSCHHHQ
jgi:hypothetical protein